jgi:hypothetical protein
MVLAYRWSQSVEPHERKAEGSSASAGVVYLPYIG